MRRDNKLTVDVEGFAIFCIDVLPIDDSMLDEEGWVVKSELHASATKDRY